MIRKALPREANLLTILTKRSKQHWGYPENYMDAWAEDLTIHEQYIEMNTVFVFEDEGEILGYVSFIQENKDLEIGSHRFVVSGSLDNLFIEPDYIGQGLGQQLVEFLIAWCVREHATSFYLVADPHAKGFYEKLGFLLVGEQETQIPNRSLPIFLFKGE
ncbi:GNAT family N-acetyltransferase [Enterococcus sp. BWR-S5]|uniref:GNAT family N-acetyltransferase n=1 Tax=Enterococcus sp. BWR-S5 TaxID=2787714 RepID=UPI00192223FA|nr:GNAT family N-acetyltransferase [Enterococcus sp. BWR-S5]MBL1224546.1 GNAT family N-acetyltransferase [Enterococcus sp. BWR-S5]